MIQEILLSFLPSSIVTVVNKIKYTILKGILIGPFDHKSLYEMIKTRPFLTWFRFRTKVSGQQLFDNLSLPYVRYVNQVVAARKTIVNELDSNQSKSIKINSNKSDDDQGWTIVPDKIVNDQDRLVYVGSLESQVKRVKIFSLATSTLGLVCQPIILNKSLDSSTSKIAIIFVGWTCLAVICSPLLLNYVTKRYITRLTFNQQTGMFTASTLNFINRPKQLTFDRNDVHVPAVPGMFTSFKVKGCPLLLDPSLVIDKQAYMHLMGYDKPIDEYIRQSKSDADQRKHQ